MRSINVLAGVLLYLTAHHASAEQNWIARYQTRSEATRKHQPHWATPLVTTSALIEQGFRADFIRQNLPGGQTAWTYGNGHGLQLIPFARTELRLSVPPFLTHSDPQIRDGFGDVGFRLKTRLYGSDEHAHNAIVSAFLGATYPTGKQKNGSCCALLTPTLELGKGWGPLAFTTSFGGVLPASNTKNLGRSVVLNQAVQYKAIKSIWLQDEFNATLYEGAKNDGRKQLFTTPGIVVSRIALLPAKPRGDHGDTFPASPALAVTFGFGEQIALTHFNTYNHALIFSGRIRF